MRTPLTIHRCLIIVSLITAVSSSTCFIKAECRTNGTIITNKTCTVLCPPSCLQTSFPIWGAGRYVMHSSICRAAIHDVRLNGSAQTSFNVTVRRKPAESIAFHSLVRNQITSLRLYPQKAEYFIFTSPRITEPIEDITLLLKIPTNGRISTVECYYPANNQPELGLIDNGAFSRNEVKKEFAKVGQGYRTRYSLIIDAASEKKYGIVYCTTKSRLSMWSFVTASLLNSQSHFHPQNFTSTVNIGDSVNINMVFNNFSHNSRRIWFKDDIFLQNQFSNISYENVQLGHTGFYSIDYASDRNIHKGTMKIIVRDCKKDRYGEKCSKTCPPCENGGICHDTTGVCICPPGFRGVFCEIGCGANRFGSTCTASCEDLDTEDGCKGKLLCIPDPYGCSCATGFHGLKCNQRCEKNYYGAGCTEKCSENCIQGSNCNIFTGKCDQGCLDGWKNDNCKSRSPLHSVPPIIIPTDSDTLMVSFRPWKVGSDYGNGRVENYQIEYKEKSDTDIWQIQLVPQEYWKNEKFNIVCYLNVSTKNKYQVRIRIQENGKWHSLASPFAETVSHNEEDKTVKVSQSSTVGKIVGGILAFIILFIIIMVICLKKCYKKRNDGNKGKETANSNKPESVPLMEKQ